MFSLSPQQEPKDKCQFVMCATLEPKHSWQWLWKITFQAPVLLPAAGHLFFFWKTDEASLVWKPKVQSVVPRWVAAAASPVWGQVPCPES